MVEKARETPKHLPSNSFADSFNQRVLSLEIPTRQPYTPLIPQISNLLGTERFCTKRIPELFDYEAISLFVPFLTSLERRHYEMIHNLSRSISLFCL